MAAVRATSEERTTAKEERISLDMGIAPLPFLVLGPTLSVKRRVHGRASPQQGEGTWGAIQVKESLICHWG